MRKATKGLVLAMMAVMVIGAATPASAKAPVTETFVNQGIYTLPDIDCTTFWLTEQMVSEKVETTTYFDKADAPVKTTTRVNFLGVVTNSVSGHTFRDHAVFTETVDSVAGTTTVTGVSYLFAVKGKGVVYAEVGYKVLDTATGEVISQAGPNDYETYGLEGLCNVLL